MKKAIYFIVLLLLIAGISRAQTSEDSVKLVINKMFEGMKSSDGALLKSCFADSAILQTIATDKQGNEMIRNEKVGEFADAISKYKKGSLDERIEFNTVKIDGPLAIAWTPYKFYLNNEFSHCGVNSFQVVRLKGEWKIQYIIDTRRKSGCN